MAPLPECPIASGATDLIQPAGYEFIEHMPRSLIETIGESDVFDRGGLETA